MTVESETKKVRLENQLTWVGAEFWTSLTKMVPNPSREFWKEKRAYEKGLFCKVRVEWETLAALGALAPYGPVFRPNWFKTTLKYWGRNNWALHFTLTMTRAYIYNFNIIYMCLYLHVFLFKNFNINLMLYIFCTKPYYTIYLYSTLTITRAYVFHFNIAYMFLYLHVFLFKKFNINFMCIYFTQNHITQCTDILL